MSKFRLMLILFILSSPPLIAGEARIAVASNFTNAIKAIAQQFQKKSGDKIILIFGATGRFYAQIMNGAPFDAYFSADTRRPALLEQQGIALAGSRFTYAEGKIVLYSPKFTYVDASVLKKRAYHYLAIANPKLAPYGAAAKQVLESFGLWNSMRYQLVRGENIGQAYQFVVSGNAELGFVALSQITSPGLVLSGSYWEVPSSLYRPIKQQAVLLSHNPVAKAFITFVQSDEAKAIIQDFGYDISK